MTIASGTSAATDLGHGWYAPPGATTNSVTERSYAFKSASSDCGRDDRGQEAALDTDASLTMAPWAQTIVVYDDVCSGGNDGTLALAPEAELVARVREILARHLG